MQERHIEELAEAYALGALEPEEVAEVERHTAHCAACRDALAQASATASYLLFAAPSVAPPPALRERVLARVRAEAEGTARQEEHVAAGQTAAPTGIARLLQSLLGRETGQADALLRRLLADPATTFWDVAGTPEAPGAGARLVGRPDGREAVLLTHGLRPLAQDREYQVWLLRGGQPVPNALFSVDRAGRGVSVVRAAEALSTFEVVAVTPEPRGGRPAPTGPIVLASPLART